MNYTVILLYDWSKHSDDIKNMFQDNGLLLNSTKTTELTSKELEEEYKKFKVDEYFYVNGLTTGIVGLAGYYELDDKSIIIKIIKNNSIDNMILVYKGTEESFYKEFVVQCKDVGSLVIKIEDDEVVFKKRINVELIKKLNDIQGENDVKIKNFIEKMSLNDGIFSDDFKNQWIECIKNDIDMHDEK